MIWFLCHEVIPTSQVLQLVGDEPLSLPGRICRLLFRRFARKVETFAGWGAPIVPRWPDAHVGFDNAVRSSRGGKKLEQPWILVRGVVLRDLKPCELDGPSGPTFFQRFDPWVPSRRVGPSTWEETEHLRGPIGREFLQHPEAWIRKLDQSDRERLGRVVREPGFPYAIYPGSTLEDRVIADVWLLDAMVSARGLPLREAQGIILGIVPGHAVAIDIVLGEASREASDATGIAARWRPISCLFGWRLAGSGPHEPGDCGVPCAGLSTQQVVAPLHVADDNAAMEALFYQVLQLRFLSEVHTLANLEGC